MKINHSRRKFFQDTGKFMAVSSYMFGLENLLGILLQQQVARADDTAYPYKYVNILTPNGPPRWYFDQPLNPSGLAADFNPGSFGTHIANVGGIWKSVYKTKAVSFGGVNVHMAPLWALKSAVGGTPFASLLDNAVMIRGLNMEIDSHPTNQERSVRPFAAAPSISGVVGSVSSAPSPSIGFSSSSTTQVFKSPVSMGGVAVSKGAPIKDLILPFNVAQIVKKDDLDFSIKQAISAIDRHVAEQGLSSHGSDRSLNSTYDMFARNLTAFQTKYTALLQKYTAIAEAEMRAEFPGVTTDLASIKPDGKEQFSFASGSAFKAGNLKTILAKMSPAPSIAQAFAFIEFALSENLTSSITVDLGTVPVTNPADNGGAISNDQHYVGTVVSTLVTSLYYRCTLGCLAELKNALTPAGIFDKTVIHFTSEFSRTPELGMSGSNHGFESSSTSIFSGMIKKGAGGLIGNVGKQAETAAVRAGYPGTWGLARPIKLPGGATRDIINDDVICTVCEMLEVPKIGTKGVSLVKNSGGNVTMPVKGFKNVA